MPSKGIATAMDMVGKSVGQMAAVFAVGDLAAKGDDDSLNGCPSVNSDACVAYHEHIYRILEIESELNDVCLS